jgi:hypothetical protein
MDARAQFFFFTSAVAITVFTGLAVQVISRNSRKVINWVFGLFCLIVFLMKNMLYCLLTKCVICVLMLVQTKITRL